MILKITMKTGKMKRIRCPAKQGRKTRVKHKAVQPVGSWSEIMAEIRSLGL